MTEAAPILLAVELDAMDARGRIVLAAGEGVPRHDGPGHGQAWRRMVTRRIPNRGKTAPPSLSRQLNRVLQTCGRAVIRAKVAALQDRFGIVSGEATPACTSLACSCCNYVPPPSRETFRSCGAALERTPVSLQQGALGDAVPRHLVPCSDRRRQSWLARCTRPARRVLDTGCGRKELQCCHVMGHPCFRGQRS